MAADLTNTELLAFLQDKVLVRLASIDTQLAITNGTIAQNVRAIANNTTALNTQRVTLHEVSIEIARLQERGTQYKEQLIETSSTIKGVIIKVWDNAVKIAALAGTVALITKLANLW